MIHNQVNGRVEDHLGTFQRSRATSSDQLLCSSFETVGRSKLGVELAGFCGSN